MIRIFKAKIIEDEEVREAALAVIAEREGYYKTLFADAKKMPKITVKYEGARPLMVQINFLPADGRMIVISTTGYGTADSVTKHAFKKLRRVAKNYFIKTKKSHRE